MKRIITKIIALVGATLLWGCEFLSYLPFPDHTKTYGLYSFIYYYVDFPEEWDTGYNADKQMLKFAIPKNDKINPYLHWDDLTVVSNILGTQEEKAKHYELSVANNDTEYNLKVSEDILMGTGWNWPTYIRPVAYWRHYTSFEITSDVDYNEEHPAGTSLNDLTTFSFRTFKNFIDAGYPKDNDSVVFDPMNASTEVMIPVNKLKPDDNRIMAVCANFDYPPDNERYSYDWGLTFAELPTITSKHKLSIKMTTNDNVTYTQLVDVDFGVQNEE